MPDTNTSEVLQVVQQWAKRLEGILDQEFDKLGIGQNDDLRPSVRHKVYQMAGDMIGYDLSFLGYGRFVDIGTGKGNGRAERDLSVGGILTKLESQDTNGRILKRRRGKGGQFKKNKREKKGRKPKKWYSRAFYGQLNRLMGVVSATMVESAVISVKAGLQNLNA
ncbi:hypothetical protein [Hymenobacter sp. BT190]|uniref:hypothetical protein n=1 Tax=Hymenobacter sp. BT190 TaxID=2763505 RepID=UPI0016518202|nr:hypothetical protein [Hymenobacter sp. BT190]MBC6698090.1 hypothetical protein [Hymenobacter sp. BT190]